MHENQTRSWRGTNPSRPEIYEKSDFFSKTWELAGLVTDHRWILSAEHGLVWPEDELEYYQTYIKDLDDEEYADLVTGVGWQFGGLVGGAIPVGAQVIVLGGKDYVQLVNDAFAPSDAAGARDKRDWVQVATPLQDRVDGGIGAQKSWLKEQIEKRQPTKQTTLMEALV